MSLKVVVMLKSFTNRVLCVFLLLTLPGLASAQVCNPVTQVTKPDSRYLAVNGNEITDVVTGLTWQRCYVGMSWDGVTCTGAPTGFTWEDALAYASNQNGWRMPNIKELTSLVETACYDPAINSQAFNSSGYPAYVWSASPYVGDSIGAMMLNMFSGTDGWRYKHLTSAVRLVRGQ